jgi:predicted cobalt transporter CbtA
VSSCGPRAVAIVPGGAVARRGHVRAAWQPECGDDKFYSDEVATVASNLPTALASTSCGDAKT